MVRLQERLSGEGVSGDSERIDRIRETGPKMVTDEFAKVVRAVAALHRTDVDFGAISVPTLVRYGENEAPFMRKQAVSLASQIPGASLTAVPGGGHASNLENPDFFTDAVQRLVEQVYSEELAEVTDESGE